MWLAVDCPRHGSRVLLGGDSIIDLVPAAGGGLAAHYRCTCGHEGIWEPR